MGLLAGGVWIHRHGTVAPDCPIFAVIPATTIVLSADQSSPAIDNSRPGSPNPAILSAIGTYTRAHADTFAGLWIDRTTAASPITVAFTRDIDQRRDELLAWHAGPNDISMTDPPQPPISTTVGEAGWPIAVVQRPHTERDLRDVQHKIEAIWTGSDLGINEISADPITGYVQVGLTTVTDETRHRIYDRFGDAVCVHQQSPAMALS